jgi:hypothetical protein
VVAHIVNAAETPPDYALMHVVGCLRLSDHMVCTLGLSTFRDPCVGRSHGNRGALAPRIEFYRIIEYECLLLLLLPRGAVSHFIQVN